MPGCDGADAALTIMPAARQNRTISLDDLDFAVGFREARRWMAVPAHWPGALFNRQAVGNHGPNTY